jgi:hypothetical protein
LTPVSVGAQDQQARLALQAIEAEGDRR